MLRTQITTLSDEWVEEIKEAYQSQEVETTIFPVKRIHLQETGCTNYKGQAIDVFR